MTLGNRSDGNLCERSVGKILQECEEKIKREYQPIGNVGLAIIRAATNSRDATKHWIEALSEPKRLEKEASVFFEYIYAYTHLAMRHGFATLTKSQMQKAQAFLVELIPAVAIDFIFLSLAAGYEIEDGGGIRRQFE